MKKIIIAIVVLTMSFNTKAQNRIDDNEVKTVFGNRSGFGGFLEFGAKGGEINGQTGLFVGGGVKAVFASRLNIGFAGYGLATNINANTYGANNKHMHIGMGYGGIVFEPVIANKRMVHITVPVLLGVGGVGLREERFIALDEEDFDIEQYRLYEEDVFLIAEPGMNIEINLWRNLRLDLGASYRYIHDSDIDGLSDEELEGFTTKVGFKLGWF